MNDGTLERYAELIVRVGVDVAEGQHVYVDCFVEHAPLTRAVARAAYQAGARRVDVHYADRHVDAALVELAPEDELEQAPPWLLERARSIDEREGALISIGGDSFHRLFEGLDAHRAAIPRAKALTAERIRVALNGRARWTIASYPTEGWAETVLGEPDVDRLWEAVATTVRLDEDDPVAAWHEHMDRLDARARTLDELRLDAIRLRGPGTDLTVGLLPQSAWRSGRQEIGGRRFVANMPTEEVLVTPDRTRAEGTVRSTKPLSLNGTMVRELELRLKDGKIVDVQAETGAETVREQLATDEGAVAARRAGARGRRVARRPHRIDVLQHAFRRERDLPHRLRPVGRRGRGRGGEPARGGAPGARHQPVRRPHGLHGRRPRGRGGRHHAGRDRRAAAQKRRLAAG